jgi:hypothetical protein
MTTLRFGNTRIEVFHDATRTTFEDGSVLVAAAEDTPQYTETALRNGYSADTVALSREHEIVHVALAHLLKTPSPSLLFEIGAEHPELWLRQYEEDAVLAIQRYTRALGLDLVEVFREAD